MALTSLSEKLSDLLVYAIIVAVMALAGYFYGGIRYNQGKSAAIAEPAVLDTVWKPYAVPKFVPAKPETVLIVSGPIRDSSTTLLVSAGEQAPDVTKEYPWTGESEEGSAHVFGRLSLRAPEGMRIIYRLTVDSVNIMAPWVLSKEYIGTDRRESWWVKPAVAISAVTTAILLHNKKYVPAAITGVAGTSLIVFTWEF